jgi:transposase
LALKEILLPSIPKGSSIVMDNAAFHKSVKSKELIEAAGCYLIFLPNYSPDLNPIEHCWHTIKSKLKPLMQSCQDNLQEVLGTCLLTI